MIDFTMPSLGADMDAGRLLNWYVAPGDEVHRGDIVALVDTDKAAIEVEVWDDGIVDELLVEPGAKVPVGTVLAHLRAAGEEAGAGAKVPAAPADARETAAPVEAAPAESAAPAPAAAPTPSTAPVEAEHGLPTHVVPPHATPSARAAAREAGIDVHAVAGTGKHGVVTHADVVAATAPDASPTAAPTPAGGEARRKVSPYARHLAEELGVDLSAVHGSGADGAVTGADVRAAAEASGKTPATKTPSEAPPTAERPADDRYAAMRRAIAAAMAKSKREIPHYYLTQTIDLETALTWLEERNLERPLPERILPATLLLRATVLALQDVPDLNGFWKDDHFEASEAIHLGLGISLRQGGLIAPAILNAQDKDLGAMMAAVRDLVARTRRLQLRSSEMSDATVTVTALGDQGVESVQGVIYPPQVALIGFGKVAERPWAENGMLGVRRLVQATLAADHRASDGHTGGLLLAAIDRHLQQPEEL